MASNTSSIQVVVRLRPLNEKEKKFSTLPVIKASTANKTVTVIKGQGARQARNCFTFDNIFAAFSTQQEVFEATLKPVIRDVMQGYESTVFAYGQTGTGKTHTMEGCLTTPEMYGIIPRSAQAIFESLRKPEYENANVTCTYLEIYNEDLGDLLAEERGNGEEVKQTQYSSPSKKKKLEIMEGPDGPFCRGLKEVEVHSASDVLNLMLKAQQHRKVGETRMNRHSSRSHCLFTIKVKSKKILKDGGSIDFTGKLHMVDLAGSECAKSAANDNAPSGEQVARERERLNINRSLLTLGRVIKILKDQGEKAGKKGGVRIPYRDSKLTRILQESLGGRCKTLIVATLSPSITCIEESLSTLYYAQSANGIINKPISNSKMSVSSKVFSDTASTSSDPNAVDTWNEMECRLEYMQNQVEEAQAALARKHLQQQELTDRTEKAESVLLEKEKELHEANQEKIILREEVASEREQKEALAKLQHETEIALMKTRAILKATQCTEVCLTKEANKLLNSLEESINDGDQLHTNISEAREDAVQKRAATKNFHDASVSLLTNITAKLENLSSAEKEHLVELSKLAATGHEREQVALTNTIGIMERIKDDVQRMTKAIQDHVDGDEGMQMVLKDMGGEVEGKARDVKSTIQEGEEALSKSFNDAHKHLEEYSEQIQSMNSKFLQSSEKIASSIESRILESKDKVSTFVAAASQSLAQVKNANAKSCNDLDSTLQSILNNTSSTSSSIIDHAKEGSKSLTTTLGTFQSKMNFDEMDIDLKGQNKLMKEDGNVHLKQISELRKIIKSQKESFSQAAIMQVKQQDEALTKIFGGVQQILNEEIGQLRQTHEEQFLKFNAINDNMMQVNGTVITSGKNIFSNVKRSTQTLQQKVRDARANGELIGTAVKEVSSTFNQLSSATNAHKVDIEKYAALGTTQLKVLMEQNEALGVASKQMDIDGQNASGFIAHDVINEAQSGMENLNSATTDLSTFASDTILKCVRNDIKTMEDPRAEWKAATFAGVDNITSAVMKSSEIMSNITTAQTSTAKDLSALIESKHIDFITKASTTLREEMDNHRRRIISTSEDHSSSTGKMVIESVGGVETIVGQVDNFAENTMQCNEEVEPLGERTKFEYNSQLSSTQSETIIIQGLELPPLKKVAEYENAKRIPDDQRDECVSMASQVETMTCSSDVSTQANINLSRPPMSNVLFGKENLDTKKEAQNDSRPRSRSSTRSKSKPRVVKKRAHSRPKTVPSRKRIPTMSTPTKSCDF